MEKSETLGFQRRPNRAHSSDIATWPIEAGDKAHFYGIGGAYEDYRNCAGGLTGGTRHCFRTAGEQQIDIVADHLGRDLGLHPGLLRVAQEAGPRTDCLAVAVEDADDRVGKVADRFRIGIDHRPRNRSRSSIRYSAMNSDTTQ